MKTDEIINGNKMIAEFMGASKRKIFVGYNPAEEVERWGFKDTHITDLWHELAFDWITPYHESWDWLMPATHKAAFYIQVDDAGFKLQVEIFHALKTFDKERIYLSVIEFLKWLKSVNPLSGG